MAGKTEPRQPQRLARKGARSRDLTTDQSTNQPKRLLHSARPASTPENRAIDPCVAKVRTHLCDRLTTTFGVVDNPQTARCPRDAQHTPETPRRLRIESKGPRVMFNENARFPFSRRHQTPESPILRRRVGEYPSPEQPAEIAFDHHPAKDRDPKNNQGAFRRSKTSGLRKSKMLSRAPQPACTHAA